LRGYRADKTTTGLYLLWAMDNHSERLASTINTTMAGDSEYN